MAIALATGTGNRAHAEDQIEQTLSEAGKVWYDKYCTPCHGAGGAPGKAMYSAIKQPVDLRIYVERRRKFPAADWLAVLADSRPGGVHAHVWRDIRRAQAGTPATAASARGVVSEIARYIASIQTK